MKFKLEIHVSYVLIFFSVLAFFLFTLQNNFSSSHDSITYLDHIVHGKHLFHPHHLLYNATAYSWLALIGSIFPSLSPHYIIESMTALFGSGIVLLAYIFLYRRFGLPLKYAALGATIITFSYGTWAYSTNIEVYSTSIFFSLLLLLWLCRDNLSRKHIWVISIIHIMAILFHQVNILLYPVVLLAFYLKLPTGFRLKNMLLYTVITAVITVTAYLFVAIGIEGKQGFSEIYSWVTLYATEHNYWRPFGFSSFALAAIGFGHSMIGGHFIFQVPVIENLIGRRLFGHSLSDENFLAASIDPGVAQALLVAALLFMILYVAALVILLIHYRKAAIQNAVLYKIFTATLLVYSIFFIFWMPENLEFWIFQSVILWLLITATILKFSSKPGFLWMLPFLLFVTNYFGSLQWLQEKQYDAYRVHVEMVAKILTPNDQVILEKPWIMTDYIHYFTPAKQISTGDPSFFKIAEATIEQGNKIIIFEEPGINLPATDSLLNKYKSKVNIANEVSPIIKVIQ